VDEAYERRCSEKRTKREGEGERYPSSARPSGERNACENEDENDDSGGEADSNDRTSRTGRRSLAVPEVRAALAVRVQEPGRGSSELARETDKSGKRERGRAPNQPGGEAVSLDRDGRPTLRARAAASIGVAVANRAVVHDRDDPTRKTKRAPAFVRELRARGSIDVVLQPPEARSVLQVEADLHHLPLRISRYPLPLLEVVPSRKPRGHISEVRGYAGTRLLIASLALSENGRLPGEGGQSRRSDSGYNQERDRGERGAHWHGESTSSGSNVQCGSTP